MLWITNRYSLSAINIANFSLTCSQFLKLKRSFCFARKAMNYWTEFPHLTKLLAWVPHAFWIPQSSTWLRGINAAKYMKNYYQTQRMSHVDSRLRENPRAVYYLLLCLVGGCFISGYERWSHSSEYLSLFSDLIIYIISLNYYRVKYQLYWIFQCY